MFRGLHHTAPIFAVQNFHELPEYDKSFNFYDKSSTLTTSFVIIVSPHCTVPQLHFQVSVQRHFSSTLIQFTYSIIPIPVHVHTLCAHGHAAQAACATQHVATPTT